MKAVLALVVLATCFSSCLAAGEDTVRLDTGDFQGMLCLARQLVV